jgi:hypothetical protein
MFSVEDRPRHLQEKPENHATSSPVRIENLNPDAVMAESAEHRV